MPEKRKSGRRGWNLLLAVHLFVYLIAWIIAVSFASLLWTSHFRADELSFVTAVLLWLPILALHVFAHVYTGRRRQRFSPDAERQAYREGFADAMERLADRAYDARRLELDDEGELVEMGEKRKREGV
jgi:hypothetical protein